MNRKAKTVNDLIKDLSELKENGHGDKPVMLDVNEHYVELTYIAVPKEDSPYFGKIHLV